MDRIVITPCYGCNERTEDCHCICERYKEYEAERDKRYEEKRKRMQYLGDICYMQNERKKAWYRAAKDKQRKKMEGIKR